VTECNAHGVKIGNESIASDCVIWAAGVAASPAAKWLGARADRAKRIMVNADLTVPGHPDIFVIGDTATVMGDGGRPVPGVAPAAKQQGAYVAGRICAILAGRPQTGPFRYRNVGNLATIGRSSAVADFGWLKATGLLAWVLWCVVHVYFLIGFRNRLSILIEWIWAYITFQRGARLITGSMP